MKSDIEYIFLIVIDCGRQDYLYTAKAETPSLDNLAREATVFTNAFCQINATVPSHISLFTSKYPCDHGIYSNFEKPMRGDQALPTLLEKNGWETLVFTGVGFLSWLMGDWCSHNQKLSWIPILENPDNRGYGLRKLGIVKNRRSASQTLNKVMAHLKKGLTKEFYWIHFFDAHMPYKTPKKFFSKNYKRTENNHNSVYKEVKRQGLFVNQEIHRVLSSHKPLNYYLTAYKSSLEYIDFEIGRLVNFLKKNKMWEKSLFIVTSDHAENLAENGVFCSHAKLFDETTKVPLYWRDPAINGGKEIDALVQHVDIYPSILERLSIECQSDIRGKSLYPIMKGIAPKGHSFAFTEHANNYQYTVRTEEWQYIWKNPEKNHSEGLELEDNFLINRNNLKKQDYYENLAHKYPKICRELRALGGTLLSSPLRDDSKSRVVSQSVAAVLKGWGYL
jgi:arylsulfatase